MLLRNYTCWNVFLNFWLCIWNLYLGQTLEVRGMYKRGTLHVCIRRVILKVKGTYRRDITCERNYRIQTLQDSCSQWWTFYHLVCCLLSSSQEPLKCLFITTPGNWNTCLKSDDASCIGKKQNNILTQIILIQNLHCDCGNPVF